MDGKNGKAVENEDVILSTDAKLEFCPKYFEEPSISQSSGHDEYDVVSSALRLPPQRRKVLAERLRKKGQ